MKKLIIAALAALLGTAAFAHEIEGVQVLKGSLKTEFKLWGIKTTCKVKVEDVKNLMEEDQFGNPAYKLKVDVSMSGGEFLSSRRVKFHKEVTMTNLFADGVRDLEYEGGGLKLFVTSEGRIRQVQVPYEYSMVHCNF